MDCPELNFQVRPFLVPPAPGEIDDYILSPMRPDTAPMSHMISALLDGLLVGLSEGPPDDLVGGED